MIKEIKVIGRDGGEKTVSGKEYLNIARSSKSSINYFGENLPHSNDWYIQRAAIKIRIKNLERQLKNARSAATLLRDLVIAEELADENTYPCKSVEESFPCRSASAAASSISLIISISSELSFTDSLG